MKVLGGLTVSTLARRVKFSIPAYKLLIELYSVLCLFWLPRIPDKFRLSSTFYIGPARILFSFFFKSGLFLFGD